MFPCFSTNRHAGSLMPHASRSEAAGIRPHPAPCFLLLALAFCILLAPLPCLGAPPMVTTDAASAVTASTATLNATVNANGTETGIGFDYGMTASYGATVAASPGTATGTEDTATSADLTGLAPNTTYHFRVVATNVGGTSYGADMTFTTVASAPTVTTNAASAVTATTATLTATVNANGAETGIGFDYGLTDSYGSTASGSPGTAAGAEDTAVSADLTGLAPNTTYHFRVVATNSGGTSYGADMTFITAAISPPTVTSAEATGMTTTTVTINGTVNANGAETSIGFDYGVTDSYAATVTASPATATGIEDTAVSADLTGLTPNTTYHFRVVATNAGGTSYGADSIFTTTASGGDPDPENVAAATTEYYALLILLLAAVGIKFLYRKQ